MPETGTLIDGKYQILSKLREGGMGALYKVHHSLLNEVRVIKVMRSQNSDDKDLQRRFAQEAQLITRVRHKNICLIFDFAVDEDMTAYIVMEYIDGVSLSEWLRLSGPMEVPLALEITRQSLEALEYLHKSRIIHRDVSPENIMLTTDHHGQLLVKLIDLGIAKALDSDDGVTKTGVFIGKFRYSSPEQLMSDGQPLDGRSDVYSLAVVLYLMLTGRLPVRGETGAQLAAAHLFQPPVPFDEADPQGRIPPEVRATVLRAMEKKPEERFPDSTVLLQKIQELQRMFPPVDLVEVAAFMDLVRSTSGSSTRDLSNPTPSAQARLNRRFQPSATPFPAQATEAATGLTFDVVEPEDETIADAPETTVVLNSSTAKRPRRTWMWGAVLIIIVLAATAVILSQRSGRQVSAPGMTSPETTSLRPSVPAGEVSGSTAIMPSTTGLPPPSTTLNAGFSAAPSAPLASGATALEKPAPPLIKTSTISIKNGPGEAQAAARSRAIKLDQSTADARSSAERAGARELAGTTFERAEQARHDGESLLRAGKYSEAASRFDSAGAMYAEAARSAAQEATRRDALNRTAAAEAERQRLQQEQVERERLAALQKPPPTAAPSTPKPAVSEEPRIRAAIAQFVAASESLNTDDYLSIYPSADRGRIAAGFSSLRSQSLTLDIHSVEIGSDGQSARVRAIEQRVAIPRAGTEQRVNGERTISLARQSGRWVITGIR